MTAPLIDARGFGRRLIVATLVVLLVSLTATSGAQDRPDPRNSLPIPINEWAVELAPGTDPQAVARDTGMIYLRPVPNLPNVHLYAAPQSVSGTWARGIMTEQPSISADLMSAPGVRFADQQVIRYRERRLPTDPLFPNQWHLRNTGQAGGTPGEDANVVPAWGTATGSGVVVAVVDDGIQYTHPDIAPNWRADLSYDYFDDDNDPFPVQWWEDHGIAVAGVAAAANDGAACGVGAAYDAQIAGLRLLGGATTDAQEAAALAHRTDAVHISNNSWGPPDDGSTWGGVGPLALGAIADGATNGRNGKGVVYVWAAGNGGNNDYTTADAFVNSRFTLGIAAITNQGRSPWYGERGSNIVVGAPTNGGTAGIVTTDISNGCRSNFGGTSSAAPLAAGVIALMLEANPNLTWRDVQAILIRTAVRNDPTNTGWAINGAGLWYHHAFGFGRINAAAAVAMAQTWNNLAPEVSAITPVATVNAGIPNGNANGITRQITVADAINIESVIVRLNINHTRRGDLRIELTSPSGTTSVLLNNRPLDNGAHIVNYPILTTHMFGESSQGTWTIRVIDSVSNNRNGTFVNWSLEFYGTPGTPAVIGGNLLVNGGFEALSSNDPRVPDGWRLVNRQKGDRVMSNNPVNNRIWAHEGDRAARLQGNNAPKATRLIQNVNVALSAGDTLRAEAHVSANNLRRGAYLRVIVRYADGTRTRHDLPFPAGTYDYQPFSMNIPITGTTTQIRYQLRYEHPVSARGRVVIDAASLSLLNSAPLSLPDALPLPLPAAPPDQVD